MNVVEPTVLSVFWQKNGLGPLGDNSTLEILII